MAPYAKCLKCACQIPGHIFRMPAILLETAVITNPRRGHGSLPSFRFQI